MMIDLKDKNILIVISGGIAAYKSLELIRLIKNAGGNVKCILTEGGKQFVTEMSVSALSGQKTYTDLWSLTDETEMGHISLTRQSDLVIIAPASANLLARLANGLCDDLASTTLLASSAPIYFAPAMNVRMWENEATQHNISLLKQRGFIQVGPNSGSMACNEYGLGRMSEPEEIFGAIIGHFNQEIGPLADKKVIITAGPTYEPIDPVRFIGNRSSGKQGIEIAKALKNEGANVTLIHGPLSCQPPDSIHCIPIETAEEMLQEVKNSLPADLAICAAAVSDWSPKTSNSQKIKKRKDTSAPLIELKENPDILEFISKYSEKRPELVIGFAAETENLDKNAHKKLNKKGCDWIIANEVTQSNNVFGSDYNQVNLIGNELYEEWPRASKKDIAFKLVKCIKKYFNGAENERTVNETRITKA
jgi:phosphopantothenoylcysteine decarboxylase/phosphopantothenate--cysteine ligase